MLVVVIAIVLLVVITIMIHYEALGLVARRLRPLSGRPRFMIIRGVVVALVAHVLEVWTFGLGYFLLRNVRGVGHLGDEFDGSLVDCAYYSFVTYTSLGFGDITPEGAIRLLTGMEALVGLVLIAWTASLLFLQLQQEWRPKQR